MRTCASAVSHGASASRLQYVVNGARFKLLLPKDNLLIGFACVGLRCPACARRDGFAARRACIAKRSKYPSRDLIPFAIETGGRLSADARALVKRLAAATEDPTQTATSIYKAVSTVLQDGVARQLLAT